MKHTITPLDRHNELMAFAKLLFGNYFLETQLGCYLAQPSLVPTGDNELCTISISCRSTSVVPSPYTYDIWTLNFDGSKT